jgi:tetratricopeptide (TPR) repeat protein
VAEKKLSSAEQSYLSALKSFPDQLNAVGDAFQGLANALKQRRSWGLVTDAGMEDWLTKLTADLTSPEMQTRVELAKAGLVFIYKNGTKQYPAALERFKKAINASPGLHLSRREANQYGELLIAGLDYATATQVYTDLLAGSNDPLIEADADYGLGATELAQGDVAKAKDYFSKMTALPDGAVWHPHILDAQFGLALADEQSDVSADNDKARATYARLMQEPQAGILIQAKAMLGYGRLLEKAGHAIIPAPQGPAEYAVHYYQEPHTLYGPATPESSAEGLFDAGQAYAKAGDKPKAKKQYTDQGPGRFDLPGRIIPAHAIQRSPSKGNRFEKGSFRRARPGLLRGAGENLSRRPLRTPFLLPARTPRRHHSLRSMHRRSGQQGHPRALQKISLRPRLRRS